MARNIRKEKAPTNSLVGHNEIAFDGNDVRVFDEGKRVGVDDIPYHTKDSETILSASVKSPLLTYKNGKSTSYAEEAFPYAKHMEYFNSKIKKPSKQSEEILSKSPLSRNRAAVLNQMASLAGIPQDKLALSELADLLKQERPITQGPKYAGGKLSYMLPMISSLGAGLGQLAYFAGQKPKMGNSYIPNVEANRQLSRIDSIRYNPYPQIRAVQDTLRQQAYGNSQAGGLTGGQRNRNRIALGIGAMNAISDAYANAELQNNNLALAAANARLKQRESDRQYMYNALVGDKADFAKQSSAYNKNLMTSLASITGAINTGIKNINTDYLNRLTLGMYKQDLDDQLKARAAEIANSSAQLQLAKLLAAYNNPYYLAWYNQLTPEQRKNILGNYSVK